MEAKLKDINADINSKISEDFNNENRRLYLNIISNCLTKCVNNFNKEELSNVEESCLEKCYFNFFENLNIAKI